MGLKFGQNIKFQFFLRFLQHSGRDKACLSRHTAACRDIGRDILLLVATPVATYFPDSSLFFFLQLVGAITSSF